MTEQMVSLPDGWSETSGEVTDAGETYVYVVSESARVLVSLAPSVNGSDEVQLRVSSIEGPTTVRRHDFVVAEYEHKRTGIDNMESFMELVSESLPASYATDERLFVTIQRCIEEFNSTTCSWLSFLTRGRS